LYELDLTGQLDSMNRQDPNESNILA